MPVTSLLPPCLTHLKTLTHTHPSHCGVCFFPLPKTAIPLKTDLSHKSLSSENNWIKTHQLSASAQRGCTVCLSLLTALKNHYSAETWKYMDSIVWKLGGFHTFDSYGCDDWDVFVPVGDDRKRKEYGWWNFRGLLKRRWMHPYLIALDQPSGNTGGLKAQERLRKWMESCDREHSKCGGLEDKSMPHRLLRIDDHLSGKMRLVETQGEMGRYVCLSHRWCAETETASLKKDNLELFKQEIPHGLIYPLLKDVIKVVGWCGLEYIWIDCMCIIQDDPDDWAREAVEMASIYSNASLTISATGCENGAEGLFHKSDYNFSQIGSIDGKRVYTQPRHKFPGLDTNLGSSNFPLMRRGWVLQEFILSKRIIHFTKEELMWRCLEIECCECRNSYSSPSEQSHGVGGYPWDWLVKHYMTLDLTYSTDRLPAIGGIAKRFAEMTGGNYMAGLWEEKLVFELLWCRIPGDNLRGRPEGLRAPTWSWASVDSPVVCGEDKSPRETNAEESDAGENDGNSRNTGSNDAASNSPADSLPDTTFSPGNLSSEYTDAFPDIPPAPISYLPQEHSPTFPLSSTTSPLTSSSSSSHSLNREPAASTPSPPQKLHILSHTITPTPHSSIYGPLLTSTVHLLAPLITGSLFPPTNYQKSTMSQHTQPTAYGDASSWLMRVGDSKKGREVYFRFRPDYDFAVEGEYKVESGSEGVCMEVWVDNGFSREATGLVLRCVEKRGEGEGGVYERIGWFCHGFRRGDREVFVENAVEERIVLQ